LAERPRLALDDTSVHAVRDWARIARPEVSAHAAPLIQEIAARLV
jgi:hypothetical protein